jgi:hypothetical protein
MIDRCKTLYRAPSSLARNKGRGIFEVGNYPGDCFPFPGDSAKIIFTFLNPVAVSHITIDSPHPSVRMKNETSLKTFQVLPPINRTKPFSHCLGIWDS